MSMTAAKQASYLWDNAAQDEKRRLDAQAAIWDPHTIRYLEGIGVGPGWRCLEVGAGSGTITTWLADEVTPAGSVVATDIDTRFLDAIEHPAIEVRRLDITQEPLEEGAYDLVYARMVLMHLPDAESHLDKMLRALRPGGWALLQDLDLAGNEAPESVHLTWPRHNHEFTTRMMRSVNGLLSLIGASPGWARDGAGRLLDRGFVGVGAETVNRLTWGEPGGPYEASFDQARPYLVEYAGLSQADVDRCYANLGDPASGFPSGALVSAWGQRPG